MVNSLKNKKILNCTISTYLTVSLLDKLENIIISNKAAGNYKYTSVSDLLRNALVAHKNGMTLTAHDIKDLSTKNKRPYSLRVPQELYDFYLTFPQNVKSEIFEKTVRTYIKL
jgi:hypothetical protein